jgi:hypothetical protein
MSTNSNPENNGSETNNQKETKIVVKNNGTAVKILTIIISFVLGFSVCLFQPWKFLPSSSASNEIKTLSITTVKSVVEKASDLITTKYVYTDADTTEDANSLFGWEIPLTKSTTVFTYSGKIGLGVDLSKVKYEIDDENKVINITLPDIEIKTNEIDENSFKYPFQQNSIFNPQDMGDTTQLLAKLKSDHAEAVMGDTDLMNQAKSNTKEVISSFLTSSADTQGYTVKFAE